MAADSLHGSAAGKIPGREAIDTKGWLRAHKWLLLRRLSQFGILGLFLLGPLAGIWIVKGNLSSSLTLKLLPLTDPFLLLQSLAAGHVPALAALTGAAIVIAFYALVGGRVFCAWVCPVNAVTDTAGWLRRRLSLKGGHVPPKATRLWLLGALLVACAFSGALVWELVNPVTLLQRGLIFGMGLGWLVLAGIFLYDVFMAPRGWCGHVCPMGACYGLLGRTALLRVSAPGRENCNDCMDCFAVCPEPQVIKPALKGEGRPVILDVNCTNCGRCIDVCSQDVFKMTNRFDDRRDEK